MVYNGNLYHSSIKMSDSSGNDNGGGKRYRTFTTNTDYKSSITFKSNDCGDHGRYDS